MYKLKKELNFYLKYLFIIKFLFMFEKIEDINKYTIRIIYIVGSILGMLTYIILILIFQQTPVSKLDFIAINSHVKLYSILFGILYSVPFGLFSILFFSVYRNLKNLCIIGYMYLLHYIKRKNNYFYFCVVQLNKEDSYVCKNILNNQYNSIEDLIKYLKTQKRITNNTIQKISVLL